MEGTEQFFHANDLGIIGADDGNAAAVKKREDKRKAILLSLIGRETYSLLRNLVSLDRPAEKTYGK